MIDYQNCPEAFINYFLILSEKVIKIQVQKNKLMTPTKIPIIIIYEINFIEPFLT